MLNNCIECDKILDNELETLVCGTCQNALDDYMEIEWGKDNNVKRS